MEPSEDLTKTGTSPRKMHIYTGSQMLAYKFSGFLKGSR